MGATKTTKTTKTTPAAPAAPAAHGPHKVTPAEVRAALFPAVDAGGASASAIATQLAAVDFTATPEDESARAIQAALESVTEGTDEATGGAAKGQGARITHGQAIEVARQLRAAGS